MKYLPGRSAAAALIPAAVSMRMFWGMTLDFPAAMNAVWICPLLGFAICLPLFFAIDQASKMGAQGPWQNLTVNLPGAIRKPLEALMALLLMYDAAFVVRLTASSSNIIALGDVTVHLLIVPLGLVIAILVLLGPNAGGNSARIVLHLLPFFLLVLLAVQISSYRINWLAPLLGNGMESILAGGFYCAGNLALMSLVWLPAPPDRNRRGIWRYMLISCIGVSLLLLCFHMSFPVMPDGNFTQAARIELILSNGRMSLSPQFILNIMWYGGQLYLLAAEVLGAAVFLRGIVAKPPLWTIAIAEALAISIAAVFNAQWLQSSWRVVLLTFPAVGTIFILVMIMEFIRKRGRFSCENAH